ncbi:sigma-70 family RNA polymerase sigma factor [Streptomyces sp. NPDC002755]|uniref:sigma-70 family RNA polymerase sigma factor n=1 Tax=Streptomyces sp. NPDC002884 TaxID=3154544 RepID=UPI00332C290E
MADQEGSRSRHAEALGELVAEQYGRMAGYAGKRLRTCRVPRSSAGPEDIVQNALKSVLAYPEPIGNVRAYLYKVMDNEISRAARHHCTGRGYASLDVDVRLEDELSVHPVDEAELRLVVDEAVSALPPQQRKVILLTQELGMTQAEAARVMGAAPGTVGVHAHRAVRALRVSLVGLGVALVVWAAGSLMFGVRSIIPAAGIGMQVGIAVVQVILSIGAATVLWALATYSPGELWRGLRQRLKNGTLWPDDGPPS